jgi:hypothetical protein
MLPRIALGRSPDVQQAEAQIDNHLGACEFA